jgi:hypothetical protein
VSRRPVTNLTYGRCTTLGLYWRSGAYRQSCVLIGLNRNMR